MRLGANRGWPVEMAHHAEPQIAPHMPAAVAHGTYVECFPDPERDPLWARFIKNRAPIAAGMIEIPPGPGFGLELDWGLVERYRLDRQAPAGYAASGLASFGRM